MGPTPPPICRPARNADWATFLRFFAELGVDDPPLTETQFERQIAPTCLFLEPSEGAPPAGYVFFQTLERDLYIRHLAVDPEERKRGFATWLMLAATERADRDHVRSARLNVKVGNEVAIGLYQALGFVRSYEAQVFRLAWSRIAALPTGASAAPVEIDAERALEIESTFSLPAGSVLAARAFGKLVLAVEDGRGIAAYASFDPRFPGAFPFRCRAPEFATALLEAMASARVPIEDGERGWREQSVQIVSEGDELLSALLADAGAIPVLRTVHMVAPLDQLIARAQARVGG